jgi:hypothetical protein
LRYPFGRWYIGEDRNFSRTFQVEIVTPPSGLEMEHPRERARTAAVDARRSEIDPLPLPIVLFIEQQAGLQLVGEGVMIAAGGTV